MPPIRHNAGAVQRRKFVRTDAKRYASVGADDPVRPQDAPANMDVPMRIRTPHPQIARFSLNCNYLQICVGEGFYPSRRCAITNIKISRRIRTMSPGCVHYCWFVLRGRGRTPPLRRIGKYCVFYDMRRQICRCPTGGQRRPPLQDVLRFRRRCVQFCDSPCRGERGIDPYGHFARSPHIVRICWCAPRGRGRCAAKIGFTRRCWRAII